MTTLVQRVQQAAAFINHARQEETPDGNPLVAARSYITAMEIIATVGDEMPTEDVNERRFILHQLRQRMEMYYERAELLLGVAEDIGLIDKPKSEGGLSFALQSLEGGGPQTSANTTPAPSKTDAVVGVPLAMGGDTNDVSHADPPLSHYFSESPSMPAPAPSLAESDDSLEAFFKQITFNNDEKK